MRLRPFLLAPLVLACSSGSPAQPPASELGSCGHAHNDEQHARPLLEALELGFCSVEVDVHLVGGALLVAHDLEDARPEDTLEALYLEPLAANPRPIFLMIDVKSDAATTWTAIDQRLAAFDLGSVRPVITGGIARDAIANAPVRRAAMDGKIADLDADPALFPIISENWLDHFTWIGGLEPIPAEQRIKLKQLAADAEAAGKSLRFWQTGDRMEMWQAERDAGVDLINTDDLSGLAQFLGGG